MTNTPQPSDDWLSELFEGKLDDRQKGYLWVRLSPKSKKLITQYIQEAYRKGYNTGWQKANRNTGNGIHNINKLSQIMQLAEELRAELKSAGDK